MLRPSPLYILPLAASICIIFTLFTNKPQRVLPQNVVPSTVPLNEDICRIFDFNWLHIYKLYHRNVMNGKLLPRFIVYECVDDMSDCGGTADRIRGTVGALYIGALTGRALLVNVDGNTKLENTLTPNHIAWNLTQADTDEIFGVKTPQWLSALYDKYIELEATPMPDEVVEYMNNRKSYPQYRASTTDDTAPKLEDLQEFFSSAPVVRINQHPSLRERWLDDVTQTILRYYEQNPQDAPPNLIDYAGAFLQMDASARFSCVASYIFAPSTLTMQRLHASMIDVVSQWNHINDANVSALYTKYSTAQVVDSALQSFTLSFFEDYTFVRNAFRHIGRGYFKRCLNTISRFMNEYQEGSARDIVSVVGSHMRVGGTTTTYVDQQVGSKESLPQFIQIVNKFAEKKHTANIGNTLFLFISDSTEARHGGRKQNFVSPFYENDVDVHVAKSPYLTVVQAVEALTEIYLLSLSDVLVLSSSGYSAMSFQLAQRRPDEYITFVIAKRGKYVVAKPRHFY